MRYILLAAAGLSLAACSQEAARTQEGASAPTPPIERVDGGEPEAAAAPAEPADVGMVQAEIDWSAARTDLARANATSRTFAADDATEGFQIQSGGEEAAPVPVLLPTGIVSIQRNGSGPTFKQTEDGYFARYPGLAYDIVVHGTNEIAAAGETTIIRDEDFDFADLMDGAQVSLSRYGADYLITFECNGAEGDVEGCITQEEAFEVARGLIIKGSR